MDASWLDDLAKTLGASASRRRVLRGLGGALVATLAGAIHGGDAFAAPRPAGCNGAGGICTGKKSRPCCADSQCLRDGKCCKVQAVCDGSTCFDLKNDPANCGSCGNPCPAFPNSTAVCGDGTCGFVCNDGYKECNGQCIPDTGCCTDAECDDGLGCTVDVCGPTSHTCHHLGLAPCDEPTGGACPDGRLLCGGRCCPADSTCSVNGQGYAVCCPTCDSGSCCDQISLTLACGDEGCGYGVNVGAARCVHGTDECASCPSFCTTEMGGYSLVAEGSGTCGGDGGNACVQWGSGPVSFIS